MLRASLALMLAIAPAVARADAPRPPSAWETAPHTVEGVLGLAMPLGELGIAVDTAPLRWVSLWGGLGRSSGGFQVAAGARGRLILADDKALYLGANVSAGRYEEPTPDEHTDLVNPRAIWANAEVGYEHRGDGGLSWRVFAGVGHMVNQGDVVCENDTGACMVRDLWGHDLPYGGVGLGWSF